jgi:hypothetical protein
MSTRMARRVVPKAASYTVKFPMDAPDTIFTNKGAVGAITFTLPAASKALLGVRYRFRAVVDQSIIVAPPVLDTMIALNDLAADSVSLATGGQLIGGIIEVECVDTVAGYQWVASCPSVGFTLTITT